MTCTCGEREAINKYGFNSNCPIHNVNKSALDDIDRMLELIGMATKQEEMIQKLQGENEYLRSTIADLQVIEMNLRDDLAEAIEALEPEIMCFCSDGSGIMCDRCKVLDKFNNEEN